MSYKYIFIAGAPGSKWSSIANEIYFSPSIDQSDLTPNRNYNKLEWDEEQENFVKIGHIGAYFDPGMEFGKNFLRLSEMDPQKVEKEFDRPFSNTNQGIRIIKSHVFCHHLDYLKANWPDCPIILVYSNNDKCLGRWVQHGHFNITYPNYQYYSNLDMMAMHIEQQNRDLKIFKRKRQNLINVENNYHLCELLNIKLPLNAEIRSYKEFEIEVTFVK